MLGSHHVVQNERRRRVRLDRRIGGGGEAEVYQLRGQSEVLAKVYRTTPSAEYRAKLEWMMQHPPTALLRPARCDCWPTGCFSTNHDLAGFLMPRVQDGFPLITAFNPRRRKQALPKFDRRLAFQAAQNLAQTLGDLHAAGYVVGDLNESNVLVTANARVSVIDTDSFQVRVPTAGTVVTYRSPVGKPEYTPPELQGVNFRTVDRSYEHDRFALGVLLFQLLMEGNHPFGVHWLGSGEPPTLERAIREGMYPYAPTTHPIQPPPGAPGIDTLDATTADLFRQCFVVGSAQPNARPTGQPWATALATAEKALARCRKGHHYARHLKACPYCPAPKNRTKKLAAPRSPRGTVVRSGVAPPPFGGVPTPTPTSVVGTGAPRPRAVVRPIPSKGSASSAKKENCRLGSGPSSYRSHPYRHQFNLNSGGSTAGTRSCTGSRPQSTAAVATSTRTPSRERTPTLRPTSAPPAVVPPVMATLVPSNPLVGSGLEWSIVEDFENPDAHEPFDEADLASSIGKEGMTFHVTKPGGPGIYTYPHKPTDGGRPGSRRMFQPQRAGARY